MKKIPKSITVTVRNRDEFRATKQGVSYDGGGYSHSRILRTFPNTPEPPYRLTYSLNPKGPLRVIGGNSLAPDVCKIKDDLSICRTLICCFMVGLGWDGKRVSRHVEKVKK